MTLRIAISDDGYCSVPLEPSMPDLKVLFQIGKFRKPFGGGQRYDKYKVRSDLSESRERQDKDFFDKQYDTFDEAVASLTEFINAWRNSRSSKFSDEEVTAIWNNARIHEDFDQGCRE